MKRTALDNRNKDETESNGSKPRALQRTSNGRMLILSLQGTPRLHIPNPLWFWRFTIRWSSFMHLTAASASALPLARQEAQLRRLKINLASGFLICPCSSFSHGALTRVATRLSPVSTKSRLYHKLSDANIVFPCRLCLRCGRNTNFEILSNMVNVYLRVKDRQVLALSIPFRDMERPLSNGFDLLHSPFVASVEISLRCPMAPLSTLTVFPLIILPKLTTG